MRIKYLILILLVFHFIKSEAQIKRRKDIPVSIGISEVFSYHFQPVNLGIDVNSCHSIDDIVENGVIVDPENGYRLLGSDTAQRLQYEELGKGFDLTIDIPFIQKTGIGFGVQYNFEARDRLRYYMRFFYVIMDWDQKFHFTPAFKMGIKQIQMDDRPQDNLFVGFEADFDVRICSRLFAFVSVAFDYNKNSHYYQIEDKCGPVPRYESNEKHNNIVFSGSYGLKFKFWRNQ